MKLPMYVTAAVFAFALAAPVEAQAPAQTLTLAASDTMESVLKAQQGKRVTLKIGPGDEITGTVKAVTPQLVQLAEISGREFFDAAVDLKSVKAVMVRTR